MFKNIGGKLKTLAEVSACLGIIASAIWGMILIAVGIEDGYPFGIFLGLIVMVAGGLGSWILSFVMYGFGQLIENTDKIVEQQEQMLEYQENKADYIEKSKTL